MHPRQGRLARGVREARLRRRYEGGAPLVSGACLAFRAALEGAPAIRVALCKALLLHDGPRSAAADASACIVLSNPERSEAMPCPL
mmetsp:Transcript_11998/g.27802  ORF Transcript_11998/g.27802 Transcript_11998/m.27802 type:complete len:86 (+) Transcript_11998:281-538(+)